MNRTTVIVSVVVVLAVAGAWALFDVSGGPKQVAGAGAYGVELGECQDKIFEDLQHPLELVFLEARNWHTADNEDITVGGTFQAPNVDGGTDTMDYACKILGGEIMNVDIH